MNKKYILITGGAGFIGSTLAESLLNKNENLIILDNRTDLNNISDIKSNIMLFNEDVRNYTILDKIFSEYNIEGIIHLAAVSRVIDAQNNPELCKSINMGGIENILKISSKQIDKPWVIFGSSREVYGEPKEFPVKEDFPLIPINIYGETKLYGENLLKEYCEKENMKGITLRFSNVYGNKKDILDRVIPKFVISALKNETIYIHGANKSFDFTFIDDTVNGIEKAIKKLRNNMKNNYDVFNISFGKPIYLENIIDIINKIIKKDIVIKTTEKNYFDVISYYGCINKAQNILDFKAKISIDEGIYNLFKLLDKKT